MPCTSSTPTARYGLRLKGTCVGDRYLPVDTCVVNIVAVVPHVLWDMTHQWLINHSSISSLRHDSCSDMTHEYLIWSQIWLISNMTHQQHDSSISYLKYDPRISYLRQDSWISISDMTHQYILSDMTHQQHDPWLSYLSHDSWVSLTSTCMSNSYECM